MDWTVSPLWRSVGRIAAAGLLVLAFIAVLMTASAQQEVMQHLSATQPGIDYSTAWAIKERVDQASRDAHLALAREQQAAASLDSANAALDAALARFDAGWDAFSPAVSRLASVCGLPPTAAGEADETARGRIIATLRTCQGNADLTPDQRTRLDAAFAARGGVVRAFDNWADASRRAAAAQASLTQAQATTKALTGRDAKAQAIADSFDATTKLRQSWYLGGGLLIDYPPALLQIILSFVSGTFGALLLTLVLIVYPNSGFSVATSGGYGARVLLGGLIALCVTVVLNGGSAVLGSNDPVQGTANSMAFCAIAILAGMFSDRVAAWLSARADSFCSAGAGSGG